VFSIEVYSRCGGSVRDIACIEDQDIIDRILAHLDKQGTEHPRFATPGTTDQSTTWDNVSFRRKRIHNPNQQGHY
jgi:hypothetical protein